MLSCLFLGKGIECKMECAKFIQVVFLSEIYFYFYKTLSDVEKNLLS